MPKYSEEARRLWPYLLPFVERVSGIGNTGGGTSGSNRPAPKPKPRVVAPHKKAQKNRRPSPERGRR